MTPKFKESALQEHVMAELNALQEQKKLYAVHIPNEGKRSARHGAALRRQGLKAGAPDICIALNGGGSIFIELKVTGNGLTPRQKATHTELRAMHIPIYTVTAPTPYEAKSLVLDILTDHGVEI